LGKVKVQRIVGSKFYIQAFRHSGIQALEAREARRKSSSTAHSNQRNYARCEWKCIARSRSLLLWDSASSAEWQESINAIHCSGQRGDNKIGNDPRRPNLF